MAAGTRGRMSPLGVNLRVFRFQYAKIVAREKELSIAEGAGGNGEAARLRASLFLAGRRRSSSP